MRKTIEVCTCDICGNQQNMTTQVVFPVIFHTDQTEGRPVNPYISQERIDLCDECIGKYLVIHGDGAQGHNQYYARDPK